MRVGSPRLWAQRTAAPSTASLVDPRPIPRMRVCRAPAAECQDRQPEEPVRMSAGRRPGLPTLNLKKGFRKLRPTKKFF